MPQLILTAVGLDKPGLVGELTGHLVAHGANILNSRAVNLRGQFAMLILLEAADPDIARLRTDLPGVGAQIGLDIVVAQDSPPARAAVGVPYRLKTYSMDQPGLVHKITDVLRAHRVNIEELTARQESAPFAGTTLFTMEMRLTVPQDVPLRQLRQALEAQCEALNCDLDLEPA